VSSGLLPNNFRQHTRQHQCVVYKQRPRGMACYRCGSRELPPWSPLTCDCLSQLKCASRSAKVKRGPNVHVLHECRAT